MKDRSTDYYLWYTPNEEVEWVLKRGTRNQRKYRSDGCVSILLSEWSNKERVKIQAYEKSKMGPNNVERSFDPKTYDMRSNL